MAYTDTLNNITVCNKIMITPHIPKGFRDFLPDTMAIRAQVIRTIAEVFELYGFLPLETPCLEYAETLEGKYGAEGDKLIYRFEDRGGRSVALRYDLTIPLSRVVAMHPQLPKPFRRYQIAPVWRADKPQRGRFREFYQCDIDIIGADSAYADGELLVVAHAVLQRLGFDNFVMRINNRKVLNALAAVLGIPDSGLAQFLRSLDKLDKIGPEAVLDEMRAKLSLTQTAGEQITAHVLSPDADFESIRQLVVTHPDGCDGCAEIDTITTTLQASGVPADCYAVDISLARGLDYYTGPIFETVMREPKIGSISGGGRYDNLIGLFSRQSVPATGLSFGLERLITVLEETGKMTGCAAGATVLVAQYSADTMPACLSLAEHLRAAGIRTEVYYQPDKLKKQLKYADTRAIPMVLICGPDEQAAGTATLKNMRDGSQQTLAVDDLPNAVRKMFSDAV